MNTIDFEQIIQYTVGDISIQMGYFPGSEKVLFIKTGQGGSIYGYENKYLHLAHTLNEQFGCSVLVSSTTTDIFEAYNKEMQIVSDCFAGKKYDIYYMGVSKGGLIGCWYGANNQKLKKITSINAPLMINFHNKTLPAIKSLSNKLTMVYGSLDPSYKFVGFAERYTTIKIIEGADHQLRGHTNVFETIAMELLNG